MSPEHTTAKHERSPALLRNECYANVHFENASHFLSVVCILIEYKKNARSCKQSLRSLLYSALIAYSFIFANFAAWSAAIQASRMS